MKIHTGTDAFLTHKADQEAKAMAKAASPKPVAVKTAPAKPKGK